MKRSKPLITFNLMPTHKLCFRRKLIIVYLISVDLQLGLTKGGDPFSWKTPKNENLKNALVIIHLYDMHMCLQVIEVVSWFLYTCAYQTNYLQIICMHMCKSGPSRWMVTRVFLQIFIFLGFSLNLTLYINIHIHSWILILQLLNLSLTSETWLNWVEFRSQSKQFQGNQKLGIEMIKSKNDCFHLLVMQVLAIRKPDGGLLICNSHLPCNQYEKWIKPILTLTLKVPLTLYITLLLKTCLWSSMAWFNGRYTRLDMKWILTTPVSLSRWLKGFIDWFAIKLLAKYSSRTAYSNLTLSFLLGLEKFARKVKSPLKFPGESKYITLRLAWLVSKTGFLGLTTRKTIRVVIPNKMMRMLNIKQMIALHQMAGSVLWWFLNRSLSRVFPGKCW